jgi:hypothetical protein
MAEDACIGVDDHLNFLINSVVSAENTCLRCHQLTDLLETSQMEVKSLQLVVRLLQKDGDQNNTEPVVESCDTEYISKSKDGRNGAGKKLLNNINALQDNTLAYKSDIDGLLSVLHTIKNR